MKYILYIVLAILPIALLLFSGVWFLRRTGIYPFSVYTETKIGMSLQDSSYTLKVYKWKNFEIIESGYFYELNKNQLDSIINKYK